MQKGTSRFGADVIVGSKEYWRRYREANRERYQLVQKRHYLKRRELILAAEHAIATGQSIAESKAEIEERLAKLNLVHDELVEEGKLEPPKEVNEFFQDIAKARKAPYALVEQVMDDETIEWADKYRVIDERNAALTVKKEKE